MKNGLNPRKWACTARLLVAAAAFLVSTSGCCVSQVSSTSNCARQDKCPKKSCDKAACYPMAVDHEGMNSCPNEDGFVSLFNGENLDGWEVMGDNKGAFSVQDGTLYCDGSGSFYIRYKEKRFDNFILRLEFKLDPGVNSGIFLRVGNPMDPVYDGFEMQVLEDYGKQPNKNGCGAIYDVVVPMFNMSKPAGEWNAVSIYCNGGKVLFELNGRKIIDVDFDELTMPIGKFKTPYAELPRTGWIGLQDHLGKVWYRNIRIKELPCQSK